jgi:hypothetical protein
LRAYSVWVSELVTAFESSSLAGDEERTGAPWPEPAVEPYLGKALREVEPVTRLRPPREAVPLLNSSSLKIAAAFGLLNLVATARVKCCLAKCDRPKQKTPPR